MRECVSNCARRVMVFGGAISVYSVAERGMLAGCRDVPFATHKFGSINNRRSSANAIARGLLFIGLFIAPLDWVVIGCIYIEVCGPCSFYSQIIHKLPELVSERDKKLGDNCKKDYLYILWYNFIML